MLDTGLSILDLKKKDVLYLIQHRASRIENLALYGSSNNANDIFIFGSDFSVLGILQSRIMPAMRILFDGLGKSCHSGENRERVDLIIY